MKAGILHILIILWLGSGTMAGQYFSNPSFEGLPGIAVSPPHWPAFDAISTPDTEPLECDSYHASHGDTYLTLVTRGPDQQHPNSFETVITTLLQPLEAGKYYQLTIDLASRDDVGHFSWEEGFVAYTSPAKLKIFGTETGLDKGELMSESSAITNQAWGNYSFILFPQLTIRHLVLEAGLAQEFTGSANLLLDQIDIVEIDEPPLEFGDLVIPNVFTPNGDGSNDEFVIRGLTRGSCLMVYDRTGREVFKSDNYENDWDGADMNGRKLPPDTYWYLLFPSDMTEVVKGFVYLKIN
ncbi:MAG: gliding motility-associated C-terminal domain-containing protein [Bacteroidales bacterium]|nr:gliding motility-associated C-terminal domain-containing protein [Bacteroidales bacterium]